MDGAVPYLCVLRRACEQKHTNEEMKCDNGHVNAQEDERAIEGRKVSDDVKRVKTRETVKLYREMKSRRWTSLVSALPVQRPTVKPLASKSLKANVLYRCHHTRTWSDHTCPPVNGLLSALTEKQWLLSGPAPHKRRFPTTGFEVKPEGS